MTIVGAFLGSGVEIVPAGKTLIKLQVLTSDRQTMGGAIFTISGGGSVVTETADASGRAEKLVDSGYTYTVSLNYATQNVNDTQYFNDEAQTVIANSAESVFVYFDLISDEQAEVYTNLSASTWTSDTTYEDFPYRCDIAIQGVTSADYAEVVFSMADAMSGEYGPICETHTGGVYIYSENNDTITIPTIYIRRN